MDQKELHELIKIVNKSNLAEFKYKDGDVEISMRTKHFSKESKQSVLPPQVIPVAQQVAPPVPTSTAPAAAKSAETPTEEKTDNYIEIKSPIVGTFYRSPSPDKPAYKKVGDQVSIGEVVCIVEAMKLFNEIESEVSGTIVKVIVEDASPVEYDQVLFLVEPN